MLCPVKRPARSQPTRGPEPSAGPSTREGVLRPGAGAWRAQQELPRRTRPWGSGDKRQLSGTWPASLRSCCPRVPGHQTGLRAPLSWPCPLNAQVLQVQWWPAPRSSSGTFQQLGRRSCPSAELCALLGHALSARTQLPGQQPAACCLPQCPLARHKLLCLRRHHR